MTDKRDAPAGWAEAIERGEADLAAGRAVPCDEVEQGPRDAMNRVKAKQTPIVRRAG